MEMIRMTNGEYHADRTAISKSGTDYINKSPLHFWQHYLNPERPERKPTKAFIMGTAVHKALLEPLDFGNDYTIAPELNLRTKEGRDQLSTIQNAYADKTVITLEMYDTIMRMRDSVSKHPIAMSLLEGGEAETTHMWIDPLTGVKCKCRPDYLSKRIKIVSDIKTTEDASPEGFSRSVLNYRYHVQSAFYVDGIEQSLGESIEGFVFIAVEKEPPYAVALYYVDNDILALGREIYRTDLATYKRCLETNQWHGYDERITNLRLPSYAFKLKNM